MLISIEIMLLSITFLILVSSLNIDDIIGQAYAIYIIVVAGAESAIGLGILVAFYRLASIIVIGFLRINYYLVQIGSDRGDTPALEIKKSKNIAIYRSIGGSFNSRSINRLGIVPYRSYSQLSINSKLHPWFVSGFTDAEGCFKVSITRDTRNRSGFNVQAFFQIILHRRDIELLRRFQIFFGGIGTVSARGDKSTYMVSSLKFFLKVLIPHLDSYPLITNKLKDYLTWKAIVEIMEIKGHLTEKGLNEVVGLKASLNRGLPEELKTSFAHVTPIIPYAVQALTKDVARAIPNKMWMAGFVAGEGSFFVNIFKSSHHKLGYQVRLEIEIVQHMRDELLIKSFISFFDCGIVSNYSKDMFKFKCVKLSDIQSKIIPFFKEYSIEGIKRLDFNDFCKVGELMDSKAHLTTEGLYQIRALKAGMNRGRPVPYED
jgi:hypothetical protein